MADAYRGPAQERDDLLVLLHGFAAAGDPAVGARCVVGTHELYRQVQDASGADEERMRDFWAHGMLLTVAAAIELPRAIDEHPWVAGLIIGSGDAAARERGERQTVPGGTQKPTTAAPRRRRAASAP
jgi:hypothetical protein